jgi:PAS domain S-box-containing protein
MKENDSFMGITPDDLIKRIDQAPVGILVFSGAFEVIFLNETFRKIAEYYHFRYPEKNLNNELNDLEVLREDLNYLPLGYSFEKEVKSVITPGIGKVSLIMKGMPFFEGEKFSGGVITAEDIRLSGSEDIKDNFRIEEILKTSGDYIFITDKQGKIRYSTGLKYSSDIIYQSIFEIISGEYRKNFSGTFHEAGLKRLTQKITLATVFNNELYECRIHPLINPEGKADFYLFSFIQAGEFLKENLQLRQSLQNSEKFRSAADSADEMIYIYDRELQLYYSNRKAENLPNVAEYFDKKEILARLNNHPRFSSDFETGGRYYNAVFINSGEDLISCFCRETTSEKSELKRIKDSEELLRNIFSGSEIILINVNKEGNIIYSNKFFRDNFDLIDTEFRSIIDKSFRENFELPLTKTSQVEIPVISHGSIKHYLFSFSPAYTTDGEFLYITITGTDITRMKENYSETAMYQDLFKKAADGIVILRNGRIFQFNRAFASLFGYTDEELLNGKNITDLCPPGEREKLYDQIREVELYGAGIERFEFSGKKLNGTEFYLSASFAPLNISGTTSLVMICRDVNERRRVQNAIRESEEKFRNLTENIDDFLYTYERVNNILKSVFYTASVEKITGYTHEDFLSDQRLMFKVIHPDDLSSVKRKLKTLLRSRIQNSEEMEFRIINSNGNIVWVRNKINIIRDPGNRIEKIFGLVSDITLRKKAEDELKRSTENLVKLNDAKDKFISIISHDLRTPFSSILGFTDLLLTDEELSEEEKKQYAMYIQESSRSMLSLVNSLLDWTRLQTGRIKFEPEKFHVVTIIDEAIQVLSGSAFQKKIDIVNSVKEDLIVFADKGLLLQALSNLISNAIKFTKPGGRIEILAEQSKKLRFLQLSVKDNGVGISEDNLQNLFRVETKYTSEGTAGEKGSGLGLSLVKEIIEKHGGEIWVESIYKEGSEFKFTIPVTPSNILLVDDSNTDRLLYSKLLKNFAPDYNIETASSGKEALDIIKTSPPALIITDHLMPGINGYEFVLQLKKSNLQEIPPVIVLSSELNRNIITAYNDAGIENIFQKPVNLVEFKQTVEKLLRRGYIRQ